MKIVKAFPPNIELIRSTFNIDIGKAIYFCYGDTIYNPSGDDIHPSIIGHEEIHSIRQASTPDKWWERYCDDRQFRLDEEIPAHRTELRFWAQHPDAKKPVNGYRSMYHFYETKIAQKLSSPLYGGLISTSAARRMISLQ